MPRRFELTITEGERSIDGRVFAVGAIRFDRMPFPLMWQPINEPGHDGSVLVGSCDEAERLDGGQLVIRGTTVDVEDAERALVLIESGALSRWSPGVADATVDVEVLEEDPDTGEPLDVLETCTDALIYEATLTPLPAFDSARLVLLDELPTEPALPVEPLDEEVLEEPPAVAASGACCNSCADKAEHAPVTAGGPSAPPAEWFADPQLDGPTPITIDDDGRVYGHIAAFGTCHTGIGNACVTAPRSASGYAYFATGETRTAEGTSVPTGRLTVGGGHADLTFGASAAMAHYDDVAAGYADVAVGEDEHGIWVAGTLVPDLDEATLRVVRATSPSGDWRPIAGALELVAACNVNVPGFPVPRVRARVASGSTMALVAAGSAGLARRKSEPWRDRLDALEAQLAEQAAVIASLVPVARERNLARLGAGGNGPQPPSGNAAAVTA